MSANGLKIVFGSATFLKTTVDEVAKWLEILDEHQVRIIDTAAMYGDAEAALGAAGAASRFTIDTKFTGGFGGEVATRENVIKSFHESAAKLKTDSVDIYYIHAPDRKTSFRETLSGLDELHKKGAFKRLGLSNFLGSEIEEIVRIAKENDFVVPSVYQGNYSAVARRADDEIFPILRKHNIQFYAYSPIAGGFLAKSKAALTEVNGRFGEANPLAQVYNGMYNRPSFLAALDVWDQIAQDEEVSRAELAYRWVAYHSELQGEKGDAIIIGASREQQFRDTYAILQKGPLSEATAKRIDGIWESVKGEALLDNFELANSR